LTVALMLGNKFLDDNTYTNKTWAEVSGISVGEIHVMEVEFLSNMRYTLLASKDQWQEWQEKLGKFWIYCDKAAKAPFPYLSPVAAPSFHPTLPSPPGSLQTSPPSLANPYPATSASSNYTQPWASNHYAASLPSPLSSMSEVDMRSGGRKRSCDSDSDEPATKRVLRPISNATATFPPSMPRMRQDVPRLPVPNLTVSTSQPMNTGYSGVTSLTQNLPLLPPLSGRAMSTVYPSTPSWTPQLPVLTPSGLQSQNGSQSVSGYGTPTRRHSPRSVQDLLSLGSSPVSANFPNHNTGHISPSFFLQQRASPYRPVRNVNTLLYPPPSASMHDFAANVEQMHYQPLGKRNDYRTGVVPEYASHPYQQWPILPQPNLQILPPTTSI